MIKEQLSKFKSAPDMFSNLTAEAPCRTQRGVPHLNDFTVHLPAVFIVHVSNNASDGGAHFLNGADVSAVRRAWLWAGWSDWLPLKKINKIKKEQISVAKKLVAFVLYTFVNTWTS